MTVAQSRKSGLQWPIAICLLLPLVLTGCGGSELSCIPHDVLVHIGGETDVVLSLSGFNDSVEIYPLYEPASAAEKITNLGNLTLYGNPDGLNLSLTIHAVHGGHVTVYFNATTSAINDDAAYVRVTIIHSDEVFFVCIAVGWIYFVAWSVSFYPQIYENFKRKCVVGLNLDYVVLNVLGHFVYGMFNLGLYWIPSVQLQYYEIHPMGVIPVQTNDVVFSVHATVFSILTAIQCIIYERGDQKVSPYTWAFIGASSGFIFFSTIAAITYSITYLSLLYYCSYVKLLVTLIKYIPQAHLNYKRQSTVGYSIGGVLLDITGGLLSVLQMFLLAYNNDDWDSLFGDPTKFGLGLFSVMFDLLFIVQHYVLYRNNDPSPVYLPINRDDYLPIDDDRSTPSIMA
ncbi:cystinosin-like [Daphnia pulex]|uniref:cystinosin-like n=1 Tax=Daphnia pulex TaxID=6669 RepID=UPI001EE0F75F|nr:cystinosin-like [Daphnia pulex]XP_046439521.1 cystinosin-like [Daphnia pulex]XP_046637414.1 cystinosin-like [Daphnia pulicaria]XP_046637421.1 cystinosin-like [Daphnia pulicaria]XP_046637429.1 cystinosin-like [Daphnia pulicaria]